MNILRIRIFIILLTHIIFIIPQQPQQPQQPPPPPLHNPFYEDDEESFYKYAVYDDVKDNRDDIEVNTLSTRYYEEDMSQQNYENPYSQDIHIFKTEEKRKKVRHTEKSKISRNIPVRPNIIRHTEISILPRNIPIPPNQILVLPIQNEMIFSSNLIDLTPRSEDPILDIILNQFPNGYWEKRTTRQLIKSYFDLSLKKLKREDIIPLLDIHITNTTQEKKRRRYTATATTVTKS